ncbi:MAG: hypothetical protein JXB32_25260 [Deltaproteobacteria bacterium]|nr:hypothetical protein [Deltaproteobacteria bacterium]
MTARPDRSAVPRSVAVGWWLGLCAAGPGCYGEVLLGSTTDGDDQVESAAADAVPTPPVEGLGSPGWGVSGDPWVPPANQDCRFGDRTPLDVWVEDETIYSLQQWQEMWVSADGSTGSPGIHRVEIDVNDGTGWTPFYEAPCSVPSCTSCFLPGCPAAFLGMVSDRLLCRPSGDGLGDWPWVHAGGYESWVDTGPIQLPFFVRDDLAYGFVGGSSDAKVVRWNGGVWEPLTAVLPYEDLADLWADEENVFLVGSLGTVLSLEGDAWRIHETRMITTFDHVWGFGADDVWAAGGSGRLVHYDGRYWADVYWEDRTAGSTEPCRGDSRIRDMAGADGTLYFHSEHQLVRWRDGEFTDLGWWPGTHNPSEDFCTGGVFIQRMRVIDADRIVLIAGTADSVYGRAECRATDNAFILYWDGTTWHWV